MTRRLTIDQKIQRIMAILLGVVDGVTTPKAAYDSIEDIVHNIQK